MQRTDLALALAALWLGRSCNRMDYAAGFIFMRRWARRRRRLPDRANVLPWVFIAAQETLPELATRLAGSTEKNASSSTLPCRTNCP
ncbi:hypothetical protein ACNKHK_03085 [Shigella flexneri]